jgi:hypothetical protein
MKRMQFELPKANPSRGGDAKPEVSQGSEIARLPAQAPVAASSKGTDTKERDQVSKSKFKFRHAKLLTSIIAIVAVIVDSGAGHKF